VIDPRLRSKVEQAARNAAQRARQIDLVAWWERLRAASCSDLLAERLEQARTERWAGAVPTWEVVDLAVSTTTIPPDAVGVDGSQVYPPDRSPFRWAYVQAVAYRTGHAPLFESRFVDIDGEMAENGLLAGELFEHPHELASLTDAWRSLLEMRLARQAAQVHPGTTILLDGGLLPWLSVSGRSGQKHLKTYLENLLAIRPALLAGVISAPQSRLLARLVSLVEAESVQDGLAEREGVLDIALMRYLLAEGQRSALFLHGSPRNELFCRREAGVYFFFLRLPDREIARVEVPEWVAMSPESVEAVQAAVSRQAQATGYPYVLAQAHQQATVPAEIAQIVQSAGLACYWAQAGQVGQTPAKLVMKEAGR
jgi:hypothetical protein